MSLLLCLFANQLKYVVISRGGGTLVIADEIT